MDARGQDRSDPFVTGQVAMAQAAWSEARVHFEAALALGSAPEIHEDLSWACWWQEDFLPLIDARETAFRLYRKRGDDLGAARMALWMAFDYCDFRGEAALSEGWLRRAETLLGPRRGLAQPGGEPFRHWRDREQVERVFPCVPLGSANHFK